MNISLYLHTQAVLPVLGLNTMLIASLTPSAHNSPEQVRQHGLGSGRRNDASKLANTRGRSQKFCQHEAQTREVTGRRLGGCLHKWLRVLLLLLLVLFLAAPAPHATVKRAV